jgi:hypothetical protein
MRFAAMCAYLGVVVLAASFAPVNHHGQPRSERLRQDDAQQDDDAEARERKREKVRKFLEASNQRETSERTLDVMLDSFDELGMPAEFKERFKELFDLDEVLEFSVETYAEHLEESTIDALVAFYETDEGKQLGEALPDITVEVTKKGQEYGRRIGIEAATGK